VTQNAPDVTGSALLGHSAGMTGATALSPAPIAGVRESTPAAGERRGPPDFDAVYEAHFQFVWRSLRRLGVAGESLDDALQDVFLAVHRRLHEFEARSSIKTWLFGFALRVARDHRRRATRKGGLEPLTGSLADAAPGPHEQLEQAESLRLIDAVLGELDDAKREVFIMGEIEQMSAPEIAEVLGLNLNTVYSRLRLARRAFEIALERRGEGR
jgi:RNA polymerase sigma-70 factor (ECF subfamily)